ncbi:hypothetical protein HYU50_03395 [Candidatus Woesearchaeota archaeon]|nr:hypothetical protein [Candidatus Woesearchaeota archaeon]
MKLFYAIMLVLLVLVSACAQQTAQTVQPIQPTGQPTAEPQEDGAAMEDESGESMVDKTGDIMEDTTQAASGDVSIVGKEGFDPLEMAISAGDAVTWINGDEKDLVITFFKDGSFYLNSAVIKPGESFEHEFKDKGSYEYWTLAYGVKGKITVQ